MKTYESSEFQVRRLQQFEEESWDLPSQHLTWESPTLQQALGTWAEGIGFVLGLENHGKSSWLVSRVTSLLKCNSDLCVLDISLDDSFDERCKRYLSVLANVNTEKVGRPILCSESEIQKRKTAYDTLETIFLNGQLEIKTEEDEGVSSLTNVVKEIELFAKNHPDKKLLVVIDSWHDIIIPESKSEDPEKSSLIELKLALKKCKAICLMTAHRRKSAISSTRVSNDDLKGSAYLKYAAKVVLTVDNDLKENKEEANLFWIDSKDSSYKYPILELTVKKNKSSSFNGNMFFYFNPETGKTQEVSSQDDSMYRNILFELKKEKSKSR